MRGSEAGASSPSASHSPSTTSGAPVAPASGCVSLEEHAAHHNTMLAVARRRFIRAYSSGLQGKTVEAAVTAARAYRGIALHRRTQLDDTDARTAAGLVERRNPVPGIEVSAGEAAARAAGRKP